MACLYAQDFPMQGFLSLVRDTVWPENSLIMAFSPAQARFERFSFDGAFLQSTEQGRIFSPHGECRWRRVDGQVRFVYLGEPLTLAELSDHSHLLNELQAVQEELLLWGIRTDTKDEWIELQVPHRFVYPLNGAVHSRGRVALVVETWRDSAKLPRFSRYHSLKEIAGGEHAAG